MKKALALILSVALILSIAVLPVTVVAEEVEQTGGSSYSWSDEYEVLSASQNGRYFRAKELSDGTIGAVYYKSGSGIYYAVSTDGGASFTQVGDALIKNATDSELAKSEEETTQTRLAKEYVTEDNPYGRGRLEAQNPNLIEMSDGRLMALYRYNTFTSNPSSKPWSVYYSSICYQISEDDGATWGDVQVIVSTEREKPLDDTGSDYGFWEPDPYYIGDDLFVYYADTATPKNLSYLGTRYL